MSQLAAFFRTAREADEASSELKLRGFTGVSVTPVRSLRPPPKRSAEKRRRRPTKWGGAPSTLFLADQAGLESHPSSLNTWSSGATSTENIGWSLLESLSVSRGDERLSDQGGRSLLIVETGQKGAIARTILESNGARDIRDFETPP